MTIRPEDAQSPSRSAGRAQSPPPVHEGIRSEYLAQFVFSAFGTAIPVPHQQDSGLDIYCTLLERDGPRAYYSVQVKSTMEPWPFGSPEPVRWIIEHPLLIFLGIVQKPEARILVYHTTPRSAAWAMPTHPNRLELIPGTETRANTVDWDTGDRFDLKAPILNFTIQDVLGPEFRRQVAEVLKFWIDHDVENLFRIKRAASINSGCRPTTRRTRRRLAPR